MLVMTQLRPRIREQDEHRGERDRCRKHIDQQIRVGPNEMEIGQSRVLSFAIGAGDSIARDIDAYANFFSMRIGVSGQEMTVAAPYLQHK